MSPDSINVTITICNDSVDVPVTIYNNGSQTLNFGITNITKSPPFNLVYITNPSSNSVTVLDVVTNQIVGSPIPVGAEPWRVTLKPDNRFAYVSNGRWGSSNSISVIRTSDNNVVTTISVGATPTGLEFTPDGNFAYVANRDADNVSKIECNTNSVVATIQLTGGSSPRDVAITPDGAFAYVCTPFNGVFVIDIATDLVVDTIASVIGGRNMVMSKDGSKLFVSKPHWIGNESTIDVIATSSNNVITTIGGFDKPHGLDITPDGNFLYAVDKDNDRVVIIDANTNSILSSIDDGRFSGGSDIAISGDGKYAYVTVAWNTPSLVIIDIASQTIVSDMALPGDDSQGLASSHNGLPWLSSNPTSGTVLPGDSTIIIATLNGLGLNSGTYTGNIIINSNDPNSPQSIPVTFTIDGAPIMDISANCLDLDTALVGATNTAALWFYNTGCDTLFVTSITNALPAFASDTNKMAVLPYDSLQLTAMFTPASTGIIYGERKSY